MLQASPPIGSMLQASPPIGKKSPMGTYGLLKLILFLYVNDVASITYHYHELVVPLLHRMAHLEKLTLYLHINTDGLLINDTHLQNEILIHMPQLHTFTFYISIEIGACKLPRSISPDDIQKTSTNIKSIRTACVIESLNRFTTMCHAYLFPFSFTHLNISSQFPNMILNSVTHLYVKDSISLKHRFVMRISKAFPMLMCFSLRNSTTQLCNDHAMTTDENLSNLIIEYPQLILLDLRYVNEDYVEQFLLETKIYLPRLTQRRVKYDVLIDATWYFTSDAVRRNCLKVKRLIIKNITRFSKDIYQYFPSL
ncbi:unnamed protein product [Rotaria magnacalcarata]